MPSEPGHCTWQEPMWMWYAVQALGSPVLADTPLACTDSVSMSWNQELWPMKVFSSCLSTHKNKQVIRICHAHPFFALTIWHPFHLFRFVWVSSSPPPTTCGLVEVESGARSSPYRMADVTHTGPWTLKGKIQRLSNGCSQTWSSASAAILLVALVTS